MRPRSRYVIWGEGFQLRCSPTCSNSTTVFQVSRYRTGQVEAWGWGSLSHGNLSSDMVAILTSRVVLGKEMFSCLRCRCTLIRQQLLSMPGSLRDIPRLYGPSPIDPSMLELRHMPVV